MAATCAGVACFGVAAASPQKPRALMMSAGVCGFDSVFSAGAAATCFGFPGCTIWASADGNDCGDKPVFAFPQKFYCGVYTILVDLAAHADARYLRAQWKLSRWGRGEPTPLFEFYLFAKPAEIPILAATG